MAMLMCYIGTNDYTSADVLISFEPQPDGQSTPQCTDITIRDDEILEANEMFAVEIQSPSLGVLPDPLASSTTVVIMDDDSMSLIISSPFVSLLLLIFLLCSRDDWLTGDFI